jgi:hypothetical protein
MLGSPPTTALFCFLLLLCQTVSLAPSLPPLPSPLAWTTAPKAPSRIAISAPEWRAAPFYLDYDGDVAEAQDIRSGNKNRSLLRACRPTKPGKKVVVVDCTYGLGSDSILLHTLHGASKPPPVIFGIEKHPAVYRLASDALAHTTVQGVLDDIKLMRADSLSVLTEHLAAPMLSPGALPKYIDVIYLDVMFDETGGKALPKKGMGLLRQLVPPTARDDRALLEKAREVIRAQGSGRVVVKRTRNAATLSDDQPNMAVGHPKDKIRFDVYFS